MDITCLKKKLFILISIFPMEENNEITKTTNIKVTN